MQVGRSQDKDYTSELILIAKDKHNIETSGMLVKFSSLQSLLRAWVASQESTSFNRKK